MPAHSQEDKLRECHDEIASAIEKFQFIEEGIKVYLRSAYLLVDRKMRGQLTTRLGRNKLDDVSLGRLPREFEKFNGNDDLIAKLNRLTSEKNKLAHKAFYLMHENATDGIDLVKLMTKTRGIKDQASNNIEMLITEIGKVDQLCAEEGLFLKEF